LTLCPRRLILYNFFLPPYKINLHRKIILYIFWEERGAKKNVNSMWTTPFRENVPQLRQQKPPYCIFSFVCEFFNLVLVTCSITSDYLYTGGVNKL
jgi:hypothetical protein